MVKNQHGFIPRNFKPKPNGYIFRDHNCCAIFFDPQTNIHYEIRIEGDWLKKYRTGQYLHLYKKIDGLEWERLEIFTSIKSAIAQLREEMNLPPEAEQENFMHKFSKITKWIE